MEDKKITKTEKNNEMTEEEKKMWEDVRNDHIRYKWQDFRMN